MNAANDDAKHEHGHKATHEQLHLPVHNHDRPEELLEGRFGDIAEDLIRARIIHALTIFPRISMSMLQIGIGTGFPPALWHPVLERLIREGAVSRSQLKAVHPVTKREQVYTLIQASAA